MTRYTKTHPNQFKKTPRPVKGTTIYWSCLPRQFIDPLSGQSFFFDKDVQFMLKNETTQEEWNQTILLAIDVGLNILKQRVNYLSFKEVTPTITASPKVYNILKTTKHFEEITTPATKWESERTLGRLHYGRKFIFIHEDPEFKSKLILFLGTDQVTLEVLDLEE